jgi:dehydration protein DpgD
MTEPPRVTYRREGRVARVVLNRPEVLNAMDLKMHEELREVWDDFEADDDLWVAILSGAGDRAFSVGQDLVERADIDRRQPSGTSFGSVGQPGWPRLTERHSRVKPVVAQVSGYALGGGFELALACDIIVASTDAVFALPEVRLGLVPGAGGVFRLMREMPARTALGYLLTGRRLTAQQALHFGIVNDVVPAAELDACVDAWVSDLLRSAPLAVRAIREVSARSAHMSVEDAFGASYEWESRRRVSADAVEGPRAFAEKREPEWRGE